MDTLFAPWRLRYVSSHDRAGSGECIFCAAYASRDDRSTLTLARWERTFALLNRYPYTSGHAMVAPIEHLASPLEVDSETLAEMMQGAQLLMRALKEVYAPHGFNLGINVGEAGGAGIEEHLHLHVVPRWHGDTNFMTVTGSVRVIPESLEAAHEKVGAALRRVERRRGGEDG